MINVPLELGIVSGINITQHVYERHAAQFDLSCKIIDLPYLKMIDLNFNTDLYSKETTQRMMEQYETLLWAIAENLDTPIRSLPFLTEKDKDQLFCLWNNTQTSFPLGQAVPDLFRKQAAQTPDQVVRGYSILKEKDTKLRFDDMETQSNQLARYLRKHGVGKGQRVGIALERSVEMLVGLLAI